MKKKIKKVTPIKSKTLCGECVNLECKENCKICDMRIKSSTVCYCLSVDDGEKCERFKRILPSKKSEV